MPTRQFADAGAQSTVSGAITAVQTTVTLVSASGFPAIVAGGQLSVIILDSGNPAYVASNPLATPYEYQPVNTIAANVLTFGPGGGAASRAAYAGTTPHAYFAGATVAAVLLAEDLAASVPLKLFSLSPSGVATIGSGTFRTDLSQLLIYIRARDSSAGTTATFGNVQFNGDTGSHYNWTGIKEQAGAAPTGEGANSISNLPCYVTSGGGQVANEWAHAVLTIPFYSSAIFHQVLSEIGYNENTGSAVHHVSGDWEPTVAAAISSITFNAGAGNFAAGTTIDGWGYP